MNDIENRIDKVVCLGTANDGYGDRFHSLYCRIRYDGERLSIVGVHGPIPNGNAHGSCGKLSLLDYSFKRFEAGWNHEKVNMLAFIWENFHLNNLNAGSPIQTFFLENHRKAYTYAPDEMNYEQRCELLAEAGLNPDPFTGYRYGTSWLHASVPDWAIEWLKSLPETTKTPAWI